MAKASKSSAADHVEMEGFEGHYAELGGTTVGWETYTADADLTPLFAGLPDDRCQCEHWGYVFEGKLVFHTAEGDEEFVGGDAYFVGPGPHADRSSPGPRWSSSARRTGSTRRWRSSRRTRRQRASPGEPHRGEAAAPKGRPLQVPPVPRLRHLARERPDPRLPSGRRTHRPEVLARCRERGGGSDPVVRAPTTGRRMEGVRDEVHDHDVRGPGHHDGDPVARMDQEHDPVHAGPR